MSEFISDLFWDTLQFKPWARRIFFLSLIALVTYLGWWNWTGAALIAAVWLAYEAGDWLGLGKRKPRR